jgi:hypothetical protein
MFLRIVLQIIMNGIIKWSWKKRSFMYCDGITFKKKKENHWDAK